jgi:23S rRNA pseudouridine1911/1915/1917 synthase
MNERKSLDMTEAIKILYEDADTLVVDKPSGLLSEASEKAPSVINALLSHGQNGFLAPITRLDREVSGVMLLAKTPKGASHYSALMTDRTALKKEYLAVIAGRMEEKTGELHDLLFKDSAKNKSFVVKRMRRGVKEASLSYEVLEEQGKDDAAVSLVRVILHTGRTHQIRVQFSSRRHPLVGDRKYGGGESSPIGLLSYRLTFRSPKGKSVVCVSEKVKNAPFADFACPDGENDAEKA